MTGSVSPGAKNDGAFYFFEPTAVKGTYHMYEEPSRTKQRKNSKRPPFVGRGVAGSMRNFTALMTPEGRDSVPEAHLSLVLSILHL